MRLSVFVLLASTLMASLSARADCAPNGAVQDCTDSANNPGEQACLQGHWTPCETTASWYAFEGCSNSSTDCPPADDATATCAPGDTGGPNWCSYTCNANTYYWQSPGRQAGGGCTNDYGTGGPSLNVQGLGNVGQSI